MLLIGGFSGVRPYNPLAMPESPEDQLTCISIAIADHIYHDSLTGKLVIAGTFSGINVGEVPASYGPIADLFSLTNGNGTYDLSLSIEHEKSGRPILEMQGPAELMDPLSISDVHVDVGPITFPEAGKYWVVLKSDGRIIQQRPFFVTLKHREADPDD